MRRYWDGAFVSEEPRRQRERDIYRDKFFAGLPGVRLKDPFAAELPPGNVPAKLSELTAIAQEGDPASSAFLGAALAEILGLQLGSAQTGFRPDGRARLRYPDVSLPSLAGSFFEIRGTSDTRRNE